MGGEREGGEGPGGEAKAGCGGRGMEREEGRGGPSGGRGRDGARGRRGQHSRAVLGLDFSCAGHCLACGWDFDFQYEYKL
eukprot:3357641-Rhodomonas_salina.1